MNYNTFEHLSADDKYRRGSLEVTRIPPPKDMMNRNRPILGKIHPNEF
jgi:hypothetical protein